MMTTADLLREGMDRKNDRTWPGNGVCRNVACNVKAMFEALKDTQSEMSMLRNTYCIYDRGAGGSGYDDKRTDDDSMSFRLTPDEQMRIGHAWDRFVTIDKNGSATATIVDATWALGHGIDSAFDHLDYTEFRATPEIIEAFNKSENKTEAFDSLTDYVKTTLRHTTGAGSRLHRSRREQMRGYVMTEYLKAAQSLLKASEDISEYYSLPGDIVAEAWKLRDKLERSEIETLFTLDTIGGGVERERIGGIIAGYDKDGNKALSDSHKAKKIIFDNEDLQVLVFDALDEARLQTLAGESGEFRARLREIHPEKLPPFDASARKEDMQELRHFASENNIGGWSAPEKIISDFKAQLKRLAGDESVYVAVTVGRTDYDIVKNFSAIARALRKKT